MTEMVEVLGESESTIKRSVRALKAWLRAEMSQAE